MGEGGGWVWIEVEECSVVVGQCGVEAMVGVSVFACVLPTRTHCSAHALTMRVVWCVVWCGA